MENTLNEDAIMKWLSVVSKQSHVYLVGCKYDKYVKDEFSKDSKLPGLKFANESLTALGQKMKLFLNSYQVIRKYYVCSAILNFNIFEMFREIISDYLLESYDKDGSDGSRKKCFIF
jgi:hypothetical protein